MYSHQTQQPAWKAAFSAGVGGVVRTPMPTMSPRRSHILKDCGGKYTFSTDACVYMYVTHFLQMHVVTCMLEGKAEVRGQAQEKTWGGWDKADHPCL